tara:strand:+ start:62 stop:364 length:303 start_codon:yes stop_codon:yes gene_type:complete
MDIFRYLYTKSDNMDVNEDKSNIINKNNNFQNNNVQSYNKSTFPKQSNLVFMDIVVEKGMCQGVYFNKENIALKCTKKAKYCKNKMFMVCEKHKNQCFGN